jgi:hypothetical protein
MNQRLAKVSEEDARVLNDSIVETEAALQLYKDASREGGFKPDALKTLLEYHLTVLKVHKALWRDILVRYLGQDDAAKYYQVLRFDPIEKVIFKLDIEGCSLCVN